MPTTRQAFAILLALTSLMLAAQARGGGPTPFDDALAAAKANMESPQGEKYDLDFGKQFSERYVNTMVQCTSAAAEADLARFDLLIRVARDGSVEEALVRPATKVAACLRAEVSKGSFINPPRGSYWVQIEMILTP